MMHNSLQMYNLTCYGYVLTHGTKVVFCLNKDVPIFHISAVAVSTAEGHCTLGHCTLGHCVQTERNAMRLLLQNMSLILSVDTKAF